ncbi:MAG: hypothetical protein OEZ02_13480 [Anaerolineae bacterium]|nr:hypothetical protein [Anaerolineae bacterium]
MDLLPNITRELTDQQIEEYAAKLAERLSKEARAKLAMYLEVFEQIGYGRVFIDVVKGRPAWVGIGEQKESLKD